jgi:small subunit ribosomal protein S8
MVTDPIADMITRLKNAGDARKPLVVIPYSKLKMAVATVLEHEGFIGSTVRKGRKVKRSIETTLLYDEGKPKIAAVRRISRPSRRVYYGHRDIKKVRNGRGRLILSTPEGIMTGEEARRGHVGGEALFTIW